MCEFDGMSLKTPVTQNRHPWHTLNHLPTASVVPNKLNAADSEMTEE